MPQRLLTNAKLVTLTETGDSYGLIEDGMLAIDGETIGYAGPAANLPESFADFPNENLNGRLVTPGLIDCHTHVVFGGDRAREFEMRLEGASYEQVARAGGGIVSTVKATRSASEGELLKGALSRVDALIAEGVTGIEIKSGYGLDQETELKMLRVARKVGSLRPITIRTTFLGAHAVPADYKDRADAYLSEVCLPALEAAQAEGLVDAVDGFCEGIAFSPAQIAKVFDKAVELGLPIKLHAEQLSNLGGTALAASYGALSADHLEYLDKAGVKAMASSGTVAVILPGAFYTLRETQAPPVELLRRHEVPMALATDCNPGSSPLASLLLTMNMGCTLFRMTPEEALAGVTREAAKALGLTDRGTLKAGKRADLAIWNVQHPAELSYRIGFNALEKRIFGGAA
ncbi:imidazolonepropionase [Roseibium alexandrii]|uniref:Imidazolonepropionase n=1 Tax=Roseibium alexandrii (strain DSM 17067 / NCIMB 14079 / DFL-11) TaxID=244592 RepID=A0A5E8H226_ROSAD|nr:imidazolonepropionase [Roseibium alexandrii]EEE46609.2 imidazolonepropionase [Roseibium alexandrii DFL-11]